jgi:hypothetical protein
MRILGNYQTMKVVTLFRASLNDTGFGVLIERQPRWPGWSSWWQRRQAQLHMNLYSQEDEQAQEQTGEEGHQMLHVSMAQGDNLPNG